MIKKVLIGLTVAVLIGGCSLAAVARPGDHSAPRPKCGPGPGPGPCGPGYGPGPGPCGPGYGPGPVDPPDEYYPDYEEQEREDARYVIRRTAWVVNQAQWAAECCHRYYGLGMAIAHHQMAWDLYMRGCYQDAIYHSLRARRLAILVIEANQRHIPWSYQIDGRERSYSRKAPGDNRLDMSITPGKDRDAVHFRIHLNL